MEKTLVLVLTLTAVAALTLIALAQDKPEENPYPLIMQRERLMKMKDLLVQVHQYLEAGGEEVEKKAVETYEEFEKFYHGIELNKVTDKNYREQMLEVWKVAQEEVVPRLRKIAPEMFKEKSEDKPAPKPREESAEGANPERILLMQMKDLVWKIQVSLSEGNEQEAIAAYDAIKNLYREAEQDKIIKEEYAEKIGELWHMVQERLLPLLRKSEFWKSREEAEQMPEKKPVQQPAPEPEKKKEIRREGAEYYPLEAGMAWTYRSGKTEALVNVSRKEKFKEKDCFVIETISGAKLVQRQWLHVNDEGIFALKDWQRNKIAEYDPPFPIARFPFKKGQKWKWVGKLFGRTVSQTFKVKGLRTVKVPAGTFTGLEVESLVNPSGIVVKVTEVFAAGVGLVYQEREVIGSKGKSKLELVKYTQPEGKKDE